jgi:hypothetical protein
MITKSVKRGRPTSTVEVANVSPHGFWLLIKQSEHFLPFEQFPWFRKATIEQLVNVQLPSDHHLYWPDLDIDLAVEALIHPDRYPLVSSASNDRKKVKTSQKRQASRRPRG